MPSSKVVFRLLSWIFLLFLIGTVQYIQTVSYRYLDPDIITSRETIVDYIRSEVRDGIPEFDEIQDSRFEDLRASLIIRPANFISELEIREIYYLERRKFLAENSEYVVELNVRTEFLLDYLKALAPVVLMIVGLFFLDAITNKIAKFDISQIKLPDINIPSTTIAITLLAILLFSILYVYNIFSDRVNADFVSQFQRADTVELAFEAEIQSLSYIHDRPSIAITSLELLIPDTLSPDEICIHELILFENPSPKSDIARNYSKLDISENWCEPIQQISEIILFGNQESIVTLYHSDVDAGVAELENTDSLRSISYGYHIPISLDQQPKTQFSAIHNIYSYPYDNLNLSYALFANYSLKSRGATILDTESSGGISAVIIEDGWSTTVENLPGSSLSEYFLLTWGINAIQEFSIQNIYFERPLVIRVIYVLLLFSMVIFTFLLFKAEKFDSFVEIAIALLFGVFGLKEILIPTQIVMKTNLDDLILIFYTVFSIVVVWYFASNIIVELRKKVLAKRIVEHKEFLPIDDNPFTLRNEEAISLGQEAIRKKGCLIYISLLFLLTFVVRFVLRRKKSR